MRQYKNCNGIVLAIPRGGVPIGYHIAHLLGLPLDILISKKIGHPSSEEFAIGSVCGDEIVLDPNSSRSVPSQYIQDEMQRLKEEGKKRYQYFRNGRAPAKIKGKTVILVDDGIATGNTLLAAVRNIRKQEPGKIVVACPVASTSANRMLVPEVDEFVCLLIPHHFNAVGEFYENFSAISDEEVLHFLNKADQQTPVPIS